MADCCSTSILFIFDKYPLQNLIGNQIVSLTEIKNIYNKLFKQKRFIDDYNVNNFEKYHIYQIKLYNKKLFYFGLVNFSNGYYDGFISIYKKK